MGGNGLIVSFGEVMPMRLGRLQLQSRRAFCDGTVGRSDATEPNLAFHRDIDPVRMIRRGRVAARRARAAAGDAGDGLPQ